MHTLRKWLTPGMQVKRWLLLLLAGVTVLALGIAYLLIDLYQTTSVPGALQPAAAALTLQTVPQAARAVLFGLVGLALTLSGLIGLNRSLIGAVRPGGGRRLVDLVDRRRRARSGPKVVAIGGGTGLSTLLRGLKEHSDTITAIVTVADDGGSSGKLRRNLGVHPPGDFRQCISALADTEPLMERLFEYRFGDGDLGGHAFGNLFVVAMTGITGSFESALRASSRVLAVRGTIVPSTLAHVTLFAELADSRVLRGEHQVPRGDAPIRRVFLEPPEPPAYPEAVSAILDADLVVLGPGSLYTSVLPNLLVPDIANAIAATAAPVLYVANVATQPGETDGYSLDDHVGAIEAHLGRQVVDLVLANDNLKPVLPDSWGVSAVRPELREGGPRLVTGDVVNTARPTRHDPDKLAAATVDLIRATGRRERSAA
ncbi:MAG: uridine diphosphate-N-acetylglucosamine-binding protein YvcK [Anaerolineae bacterium]